MIVNNWSQGRFLSEGHTCSEKVGGIDAMSPPTHLHIAVQYFCDLGGDFI